MMISKVSVSVLAIAVAFASITVGRSIDRTIKNTFNETWPLDLTYFDVPADQISGPLTSTIQGKTRPAQIQLIGEGEKKIARVWTLATIGWKDETGNAIARDAPGGISRVKVVIAEGQAPSPLSIRQDGDHYLINNGTYEFKIRNYPGAFDEPMELASLPHWIGGMRMVGSDKWDGRARFEGNALVRGAKTEVLASGPVFIDLKITIWSDQKPDANSEMVPAVPLTPGKQSYLFKPNEIPTESVPKLTNHYEAVVRFVAEDAWIDVTERAHFPRDPAIKPWGFNQYMVEFGGNDGMPIDTAMWMRWFEWDKFGGNVEIQFAPAKMREAQKGRPFAMLRPIWNQGPGGSQDFFLTTGGATPKWNNQTKQHEDPTGSYRPKSPAIGIYAAFPSKWVAPFAQTIVCRAENGDSGNWRLPLVPAESIDGKPMPFHYGQRAFGICIGPRELFDDTGRINSMVRRHTDWTLVALTNKYILEWERDATKAGPNLLISRARLQQLRDDFTSRRKTKEADIIRAAWKTLEENEKLVPPLEAEFKTKNDAFNALRSQKQAAGDDATARASKLAQLEADKKQVEARLAEARKAVGGEDNDILRLIVTGTGKSINIPGSGLWRDRRYQDDFLNPTQATVRAWQNLRRIDLFANGKNLGSGDQAAMGYIVSDPDSWMGYRQGWAPGNPNFHTDKYLSALYIGGAMRDHPHAKEWIEFAQRNFEADIRDVLLPPDGVGMECPGYAAYALTLQMGLATAFENLGFGNLPGNSPLFKNTGRWHRKLLTPHDVRIGRRHEAPIGDTHRWDSGMTDGFGDLGRFFSQTDPAFASEMMSTWRELERSGVASRRSPLQRMLSMDLNLPEMKFEDMDWSSDSFHGFGTILRTGFGTPSETFVSYKAGEVRGHYHNDENSYHYYALGMPVSLDYNCSYTPRGDHAALHNSMTFGRLGTVVHNETKFAAEAQEQLMTSARVGKFVSTPAADLVVSERSGSRIAMSPIDPEHGEFQRNYDSRDVGQIVHRRLLALIKHPTGSKMTDYLVVRDETKSAVEQQVNIHLLARDAKVHGRQVDAVGQFGVDMVLHVATGSGVDGGDPKLETRSWFYADKWMSGPEEYMLREGESIAAWDARMDALMTANNVTTLPLPGFKPLYKNANTGETNPWLDHLRKTEGQAMIPPKNWNSTWTYGEYQKWIRIETAPGEAVLWVLYPYKKGDAKPVIETIDATTVRITHGGEADVVSMDSAGGVQVKSAAGQTQVLPPNTLPPLGELKHEKGQ